MRRTKTRRISCSRNPRIHFSHLLGDQAVGDLPRAAALLAPLHPNADDAQSLEAQAYQAILERQPGPIIARLNSSDSILCSIRSGMIRISKNSSLRSRRNRHSIESAIVLAVQAVAGIGQPRLHSPLLNET
jgi:hypothetical protein